MAKITEITNKLDKNGNDMKVCVFDTGARVYVNEKYKKALYDQVTVGGEFNLVKDGDFWAIDDGTQGAPTVQSKKAKEIEHMQDRKAESIAWFNATNNAIEVVKGIEGLNNTEMKDLIREWRSWFLQEWKDQPPF